jgi:hypothetical protein
MVCEINIDRILRTSHGRLTTARVFQQDSATAHTSHDSVTALEGVFGNRTISHGLWPARSPDLTPCGFYLWDNLKGKVCRTNTHIEEESKENTQRESSELLQEEFLQVDSSLFKRRRVFVHVQGQNFSSFYNTGKLILLLLWRDT